MTGSIAPIRVGSSISGSPAASRPTIGDGDAALCSRFPLRILHVFDRLDMGGTEKVVMKLVNGFDADLFQHSICTLRGTADSAKSWASGVEIVNAGHESATFQFNVMRLAKHMKVMRPDIVHSRNWGGIEAIPAARLAGVPVTIHSEHGYQLEMLKGLPLRQSLFRHMVYRWATTVFAVSQELRAYHAAQAWCDPNLIGVLYNGVDAEMFQPRPDLRDRIRRRMDIPVDGLVVGFVGRMVALKDAMTLLRAVEAVVPVIPNIYVMLVGSGPELARLKDFAGQSLHLSGRVIFSGTSENVGDLLNAMDIFVLPSLMEGMSNTLLEALATGLPVVASRVGGNPELVDDSVCGYLFSPGDASDLATKLSTLLRSRGLRSQLGGAAREKAIKQFSLDGMLRRYQELYVGLWKRHGATQLGGKHVRN